MYIGYKFIMYFKDKRFSREHFHSLKGQIAKYLHWPLLIGFDDINFCRRAKFNKTFVEQFFCWWPLFKIQKLEKERNDFCKPQVVPW